MLSTADIQTAMSECSWTFAKTMSHSPHWYTLRRHWDDQALFVMVVQAIFDTGEIEVYGRSDYKMLLLPDGWKYWAMAARFPGRGWDWASRAILINKKAVTEGARAEAERQLQAEGLAEG